MASQEEIRQVREQKLKLLREKGINPYPISTERDFALAEVVNRFDDLAKVHGSELGEKAKPVALAGRVMALRPQGGLIFFHLDDGTGRFQGLLKRPEQIDGKHDEKEVQMFDLFFNTVDVGDFVEIHGTLFVTKRGEKTLQVSSWKMLAKSLLALPEKWHGLQDVEERFRHRYLDSLMSPEVRARFVLRSRIIAEIRAFFNTDGYIEVETPILQALAGGATALPFVTHHNALDIDFNLRIAQELYLKKMLVGGFPKVYEIGRVFRNEGIDATHNPEFTMLESQEAYADARGQRQFIEKLMKVLVNKLFGAARITNDGNTIDFGPAFEVITFYDLIKKYTSIKNPESLIDDHKESSYNDLRLKAREMGVKIEKNYDSAKIFDLIYKKFCRPKLIQPTFIIDYPVEFNPFAKRKEGSSELIDRFQLVVGNLEIVNAFSELNDPSEQAARYFMQDRKKDEGENEISPSDYDYLEAMRYGMPPNGGIGIGIDRLVMLLTDARNIKEVIYFPTLKPLSS